MPSLLAFGVDSGWRCWHDAFEVVGKRIVAVMFVVQGKGDQMEDFGIGKEGKIQVHNGHNVSEQMVLER